jgi:hypothetical protein
MESDAGLQVSLTHTKEVPGNGTHLVRTTMQSEIIVA